jgi:hypothetical protein
VRRYPPIPRSTRAGLAMAIGLAILIGGCGEPAGPAAGSGSEEVPEGIVKLKESMKERQAAKKGGPRRTAGGP